MRRKAAKVNYEIGKGELDFVIQNQAYAYPMIGL